MKTLLAFTAPLALAFGSVPATAQSSEDDAAMAEMMGGLAAMFPVEPLTAEEQSRLPAATALIDQIVPPGTLGEMMDSMLDGILGPIMQQQSGNPNAVLAKRLGMMDGELDIRPENAEQALTLIDPQWQEREQREAALFPVMMEQVFTVMEPSMKSAMAELYAVYFDDQELTDISAFFNTASGTAYARKSFTMSADPRMVGAMMKAMPDMFTVLAQMETQMEQATADLPRPRAFDDLDAAALKKLMALTGLGRATIEEGMIGAASGLDW